MKNYQKILVAFISAITVGNTYAAYPSAGIGVQLGQGFTQFEASDVNRIHTADARNSGLAGRVYLDFQFDPIWGVQLGYTHFSDVKFSNINQLGLTGHVKEQAIDLVGKVSAPVYPGIDIYGKAGAAYAIAGTNGALTGTYRQLLPTFGAGISHNLTPQVPIELSWTRIQRIGGGNIPSSDFVAIGIAYKSTWL
jgi:OOP family OmpA-OmpF porin